jgi:hypothetical protein
LIGGGVMVAETITVLVIVAVTAARVEVLVIVG